MKEKEDIIIKRLTAFNQIVKDHPFPWHVNDSFPCYVEDYNHKVVSTSDIDNLRFMVYCVNLLYRK
jgi:hypothetical protein